MRNFVIALLALLFALPAAAQDSSAEAKSLLPILMKVMTYDRNFASRSSGEFVVLVAAEDGKAPTMDVVAAAKELKAINERPLKFVPVSFKDQASLDAAIQSSNAKAVLAAPGTSANGIRDISEVAQDNQIYTLSLDADAVKTLAIGVVATEGKPQILINVGAARAIGAVFDTSVLRLAKVIQ